MLCDVKKATISVAPIHLRVLTSLLPNCSQPCTSYPLAQASSIRPCSLEIDGTPAPFVMPSRSAYALKWQKKEEVNDIGGNNITYVRNWHLRTCNEPKRTLTSGGYDTHIPSLYLRKRTNDGRLRNKETFEPLQLERFGTKPSI